jgi:hypothetical protein
MDYSKFTKVNKKLLQIKVVGLTDEKKLYAWYNLGQVNHRSACSITQCFPSTAFNV